MTLIRRNYADWPTLSNLFDDFFSGDLTENRQNTVPAVNIMELSDKYKIELAAPGLTKDDFKIDLDNNVLSISSEKEENKELEIKEGEYTKREFFYSTFKRSFTLPDTADIEKIAAKYENGILTVEIEKKDEAVVKPKRSIDIQ